MGDSFKLAAGIYIERAKRKGQPLANTSERLYDQATLTSHRRRSLAPTTGLRVSRGATRQRKARRAMPAARRRVPVRTFANWNEPPPGSMEMDLVAHWGRLIATAM
jgi:hypothetical protein